MHQVMGGVQGQAADIEIHAKEVLRLESALCKIISERTGQPYDKISADSDRDFFLSAEGAKEYGLIDDVLPTRDSQQEQAAD